jgi:hypothetical protein
MERVAGEVVEQFQEVLPDVESLDEFMENEPEG